MEIGCAECGCVVESGVRVILCENPNCCCAHLPAPPREQADRLEAEGIAERIQRALESSQPAAAPVDRWQVLSLRGDHVVDIEGRLPCRGHQWRNVSAAR